MTDVASNFSHAAGHTPLGLERWLKRENAVSLVLHLDRANVAITTEFGTIGRRFRAENVGGEGRVIGGRENSDRSCGRLFLGDFLTNS